MSAVWHHFFFPGASRRHEPLLQALLSAGIQSSPFPSERAVGGGLCFFNQISSQLIEFIRLESRGGMERILAIAAPGTRIGEGAWLLLQAGASDVFSWDHSAQPELEIAARFERWQFVDDTVNSTLVRENLVGRSKAWVSALRRAVEAAAFTEAPVLITGESGTGKELVARLIHTLDTRSDKRDLVVLDCTTIVPELSGSEFFGHERGAFTGAVSARDGAFARADMGTLFLDEVGDLPLGLQAELLRVVQEHSYKRVGANQWQQTRFRLVCATNRDLQQDQTEGRFRRDFYYRIAGCSCKLPPLRERPEDILPLAECFLRQLRPDHEPAMDDAVREYLLQQTYAGNVRDLKQMITRISHRHVGPGPISAGDIAEEDRPLAFPSSGQWDGAELETAIRRALAGGATLKEIGRAASAAAIRIVTEEEDGNLRRAAQRLGITDRALQMRRAARRERGMHGGEAIA
jgi:transcriptional regulator with GAF, ATPase, and Fis domain